jgi:alpha-L-fucosidase
MKVAFTQVLSRHHVIVAALLVGAASLAAQSDRVAGSSSQDDKMKWFRDAKFGLFIHWGLYSIPAGEWKGQMIPGPSEWIMKSARIPVREYEQLATQFNPSAFDAEAWVKFAEDCGMKYIVVSAKGHDGFAMYRSLIGKYNVNDVTPFKRDPIKELTAACARHHMRIGLYYSQEQDWHDPNGFGNTWDFGPDSKKDFGQYLRTKAEPQTKELLSSYGPVCLLRFDAPTMVNREATLRLIDIVRGLQPATLINSSIGLAGDYAPIGDSLRPEGIVKGDWEATASINHTGGFKKGDNDWKTPEGITFELVDSVSKGGNYLLNVGPTADGLIPPPAVGNLLPMGRWLQANGEAIYGAGPTVFGDEFGAIDSGRRDQDGRLVIAPAKNWRCTTKPGKLFIHLFQWPNGAMELSKVKVRVTKVYFLADASRAPLQFTQDGDRLRILLPEHPPAEQEYSPRINPSLPHLNELEHVRVVLTIETRAN